MRHNLPLLPCQWTSPYVSYWVPFRPNDQMTSGVAWFDYEREMFRIDGLFNPWNEAETGCRLWMSEICDFGRGRSWRRTVSYHRKDSSTDAGDLITRVQAVSCLVPRDVLIRQGARFDGCREVMGQEAFLWCFSRQDGVPVHYYLRPQDAALVRMVTGDAEQHASVRDFPIISTAPIADDFFRIPDDVEEHTE